MNTLEVAELLLRAEPSRSEDAVRAAKIGILDYIASSGLAQEETETQRVHDLAALPMRHGIATVLWDGTRPADRALFNGFQAHLLDIDDVHSDVRGHPGAVILSALFAASPADTQGGRFLDAYIIGVEVMARLGETVNPAHFLRGWHNTATLGGIAATAALARLFQLTPQQTAQALGAAATQAGGFRAQFGTSMKAMHAGFAARNAVEAVRMIQSGLDGELDPLYKKAGFFSVMRQEEALPDPDPLHCPWEGPYRIAVPGLWLKKYPFCSAAMPAADAAMQLRERFAYRARDIAGAELGFFPGRDAALYACCPETGEQGRFSPEYISLLGLLGIPYDLAHFSKLAIPYELKNLVSRFSRTTLPATTAPPYTRLSVRRTDGKLDTAQVAYPKGSPQNPLSEADELQKLSLSVPDSETRQQILDAVLAMHTTTLSDLLRAIS